MAYSAVEIRRFIDKCMDGGVRLLNIYVFYMYPKLHFTIEYYTDMGERLVNTFPKGVDISDSHARVGGLYQVKLGEDKWIWLHRDEAIIYNVLLGDRCMWGVYKASLKNISPLDRVKNKVILSGLVPRRLLSRYVDEPFRIRLAIGLSLNLSELFKLIGWLPRPHRIGRDLVNELIGLMGYMDFGEVLFSSSPPCRFATDFHKLYVYYNYSNQYTKSFYGDGRYIVGFSMVSGDNNDAIPDFCFVGSRPMIGSFIDVGSDGLIVCKILI